MFVISFVYANKYRDDPCQIPDIVEIDLGLILQITTATSFSIWLLMAIVCFQPFETLYLIGKGIFWIGCLFLFIWNIVLAVSLFGDSTDCQPNGLWNTALVQFIFFICSFVFELLCVR